MLKIVENFSNSSLECFNQPNNKDFFCGLSENHLSKILAIVFAIVSSPFIILGFYSLIWYERYGQDSKRTIINKLFSSACWVGIEFIILVIIPDTVRYTLGPFPPLICW